MTFAVDRLAFAVMKPIARCVSEPISQSRLTNHEKAPMHTRWGFFL